MTREDEDKMTQERYALGPNGKRVTVEQALSRAERAETQMAAEYARGVADERATPLTATPLGDALARAEEGVRYWTDLAQAEARDAAALRARVAELEAAANTAGADASAAALRAMARATKAEAERDEAQRGEQEAWRQTDQMRAERDALRAQVEAARTYARQALDYGEDCDATDLLAAMDEAKL